MNLALGDLPVLRCPTCGGELSWRGTERAGLLHSGTLTCGCGCAWTVREGLARLYVEREVQGPDRLMRRIYDSLPALHDPMVRYTLPLFQAGRRSPFGITEGSLRDGLISRLQLGQLVAPAHRPARVLEVGVGGGANLERLRTGLKHIEDVEVWGLDLSEGMLGQCVRSLRRQRDGVTRLLMADAHALPFGTDTFDRVFHVGGIGAFRDPGLALSELARVAMPGTPIVVVDEQLDPAGPHRLHHRLLFRAVTFYDDNPHCPVEHVPAGATDVRAEQLSRFFYCLSFRAPGASGGPASRSGPGR